MCRAAPLARKAKPATKKNCSDEFVADKEIVALSGAHTLGRCHTDRSGFSGPWTFAPTTFANAYFVELTTNKWRKKKWNGPVQYEDKSGELMMLPTGAWCCELCFFSGVFLSFFFSGGGAYACVISITTPPPHTLNTQQTWRCSGTASSAPTSTRLGFVCVV